MTSIELGKGTTFDGELSKHLGSFLLDHGDVEEDGLVVRLNVHRLCKGRESGSNEAVRISHHGKRREP